MSLAVKTVDLDAMRTAEAVSLLFILCCRDPQFRRSLYKLDPVLFRRFTIMGRCGYERR